MIATDGISHSYHWPYAHINIGRSFAVPLRMVRWKSEPALPFPDRRRHKRILTVTHVLGAMLVVLVLFAAFSIRSEMRGRNATDYGRLVTRFLPTETPAPKPVEVVTEKEPVLDEISADPLLLEPAARAQFLGDTTLEPVAVPQPVAPPPPQPVIEKGERVVIVGGTEGVAVVRDERPKLPKLGGGFGKE